ncbi:NAD(P)-dependent oxidoreductase [Martelella alba]|uniref:NAD(P)-dependent oxidoreductase n=1 Tax=Martelella alba TaxID=2590451 RepID=A0A506U931_9HYPH|nr:NAD(P)-dependent oxidoreductase [Martelella alba]TPW30873.1 NAD(P)-dependent oxidoreductase [Martelella alba]
MQDTEPARAGGRLTPADYERNFSDLHPPLQKHEAAVEADRCYFCYDAPCMTACPTAIDIPLFIRQISTGNASGAAKTILDQNILGGMCARVCPTETLCQEACVRNTAEEKPVEIGLLQRYATDTVMVEGTQFYGRAAATGKTVAVIGAGPAGLACAHRLSMAGHDVVIFEARAKAGGLNEYGLAAYKTTGDFAQREVEYLLEIGGIEIRNNMALGRDFALGDLTRDYDAVFIGIGLGGVNALGIPGEDLDGCENAVDFIETLRQAEDKASVKVGSHVVVLGGGMTAIDAAVQAKLLGAAEVTLCYRRGAEAMGASTFEQELAASKGVFIRHYLAPKEILGENGAVSGVLFDNTASENGKLIVTGETGIIAADHVLKAIGQTFVTDHLEGLKLEGGRIAVDEDGLTSIAGVYAGGDCIKRGEDLTVTSVAQGRDAAIAINRMLAGETRASAVA